MSKPTQKQLLAVALEAHGYAKDSRSRVTRYAVYAPGPACRALLKPSPTLADHRVYLGRNGALRFSSDGAVSRSVPFSPRTVARLLDEGRAGGVDEYEMRIE